MNDYQTRAFEFARFQHADYAFLALAEEVGEVNGKLAKFVRKNDVSLNQALSMAKKDDSGAMKSAVAAQLEADLRKELGDVFWQLAACCTLLGFTLQDVADDNIAKLEGREERGTIVGEGDNR